MLVVVHKKVAVVDVGDWCVLALHEKDHWTAMQTLQTLQTDQHGRRRIIAGVCCPPRLRRMT